MMTERPYPNRSTGAPAKPRGAVGAAFAGHVAHLPKRAASAPPRPAGEVIPFPKRVAVETGRPAERMSERLAALDIVLLWLLGATGIGCVATAVVMAIKLA